MSDVTITIPADVARSVLQAVTDDPDRSKWGHHQHNRTIAQQALADALSDPATKGAAADAADVRRQTAEEADMYREKVRGLVRANQQYDAKLGALVHGLQDLIVNAESRAVMTVPASVLRALLGDDEPPPDVAREVGGDRG